MSLSYVDFPNLQHRSISTGDPLHIRPQVTYGSRIPMNFRQFSIFSLTLWLTPISLAPWRKVDLFLERFRKVG